MLETAIALIVGFALGYGVCEWVSDALAEPSQVDFNARNCNRSALKTVPMLVTLGPRHDQEV